MPRDKDLIEDMERLADIGDRVLSGEPIESFGLTENEVIFVLGYTREAVRSYFGDDEEGPS